MPLSPVVISSLQNPRVKDAVRLRESKARRQTGRFLIDGARELLRALAANVEIVEAFVCPELCTTDERQEAAGHVLSSSRHAFHVSREVFGKLAFGDRAEGVIAVAAAPKTSLVDLRLPPNPLVAVVEGLEKPGNFGAVLRSADGAGVSAVIAADGGHDFFNPNAIRASVGAIFTLPVAAGASGEVLVWLRSRRLSLYAARVGEGKVYAHIDLTQPAAIILGSETSGLSDVWRGDDITAIELPMRGAVDSLNISTTAAVLFYEALRQRLPNS